MGMLRRSAIAVTTVMTMSIDSSMATEAGFINYPLGVNTIMAGAMPGPNETWLQNYAVYYSAKAFSDGDGVNAVPGFDADIFANAMRIFHGWDAQLGPFKLGSGIVVPVVNAKVSTSFGSDNSFGIGDITIQPLYLGWTSEDRTFFGYAGVDIFVPTGEDLVSSNSFSVNPMVFLTWMPVPQVELSGVVGLEFHTKNDTTDYKSGSLFYMDFGFNVRPFDKLSPLGIGVGGYLVKQLTDDEVAGIAVQDGLRQQGFAIGPQVSYGTPAGAFAVKWQHEFETENRPQGDRFWFQFQLPLGGK